MKKTIQKKLGKRGPPNKSLEDDLGLGTYTSIRRTEEGYRIYKEKDLGLGTSSLPAVVDNGVLGGEGGGTSLCPFDCKCCY